MDFMGLSIAALQPLTQLVQLDVQEDKDAQFVWQSSMHLDELSETDVSVLEITLSTASLYIGNEL
jgi:hypothetical protein